MYFGIATPHTDYRTRIWICDDAKDPLLFDTMDELELYFDYLMFNEYIPRSILRIYTHDQLKDVAAMRAEEYAEQLIKDGFFTEEGEFKEK